VKNLNSVFAAYMIGWSVFFLFFVSIAKRSNDLRAEVERLKKSAFGKSREK
jgi:CcmD family protein